MIFFVYCTISYSVYMKYVVYLVGFADVYVSDFSRWLFQPEYVGVDYMYLTEDVLLRMPMKCSTSVVLRAVIGKLQLSCWL